MQAEMLSDSDSEKPTPIPSSDGDITSSSSLPAETTSQLDWEPLVLDSKEKIVRLWEKLKDFPFVFDDNTRELPMQAFYNALMSPANVFYEVGDELGLVVATGVRPRMDANLHAVFFDRKLKGREGVLQEIIIDLMVRAKLHRITTIIPGDNEILRKLMERAGFRLEGTMRQASLRRGKFVDLLIYGQLREEIVNG